MVLDLCSSLEASDSLLDLEVGKSGFSPLRRAFFCFSSQLVDLVAPVSLSDIYAIVGLECVKSSVRLK